MRVVTLLPSATEIVYGLGLEPVGVSHECSYPPAAAAKPSINRSRVDSTASCADIDDAVHEAEDEHGGVYEIDYDALRDADPDLIITQGVCDVCAVDSVLVEEAVEDLGLDADILTTDAHSLGDILDDIRRIGTATGTPDRAAELESNLRSRIRRVEHRAAEADTTPRVCVLDWMDPVMVAGHWIPEMVELTGGTYGITDPGGYSKPTDWETVLDFDPEVMITAPCGFSLDQSLEHSNELTDRERWDSLSAVRDGRVYAMDGDSYVNCPSPRMVDTLEYLAGLIHPALFDLPPKDVSRSLSTLRPA